MADVGRKVSLAWVDGAAASGRKQNGVFRPVYLLLLRLAAETSVGSCGRTITARAQRLNAASDETLVGELLNHTLNLLAGLSGLGT